MRKEEVCGIKQENQSETMNNPLVLNIKKENNDQFRKPVF